MDDLMNQDLYALIGTVPSASAKEIKTAYRKKALSCHPDKNPDNPKAAELFNQLTRVLEILTDESARAAYDRVIKAKEQAKLRAKVLDSKRKKFKDDLEAREQAYERSLKRDSSGKTDEEKFKDEIERLKKEGSRLVEEEVKLMREKILEELMKQNEATTGVNSQRIKIKWKAAKDDKTNGGYDYDTLHRIFSKYGDIAVLVVLPKKRGRGMVEYKTREAAEMAVKVEMGLAENPLTLEGVWDSGGKEAKPSCKINLTTDEKPKTGLFPGVNVSGTQTNTFPSYSSAPDIFTAPAQMSDADFESAVLNNLKRTQERKRLLEKLEQEEGT